MIRVVNCNLEDPFALLRQRTIHLDDHVEQVVKSIIADVRQRGDEALLENARRFDAPELNQLEVSPAEFAAASIEEGHLRALRTSIARVRQFHAVQLASIYNGCDSHKAGNDVRVMWNTGWDMNAFEEGGTYLGQRYMPVTSAGAYVPGGKASYSSSVIMNAVPAQEAGVKNVIVTTPARRDGTLHPSVLVSLSEVGVSRAFKIGGAAAIAALALGTESIPRVDKIVGPGNRYVNEAKRQLWGQVGLDGYAGPSEVCVLADDEANARFAAADLLTQIEHAEDNAAFLVTLSQQKLRQILDEVEAQLQGAPREQTMRAALKNESLAFVARDMDQACDLIDAIAPEHLSIATKNPENVMEKIHNAGCILLGEYTPESAGDFCLGPSHTLPTSGAARFGSPVNVLDFLKVQSVARLDKEDLEELKTTIEIFGEMEGFPTHARGAAIRFEHG